jgi:hypothetical protein
LPAALLAAALGIVLCAPAARADPDPMRTVVRVAAPEDEELLSRVQGQTVDVDVELVALRGQRLEPGVAAQIRAAAKLAREHDARVVVWFRHARDREVVVYVAEPGAGTVLVRDIGAPAADSGVVERSAAAEAAALVVRSALRALAAGGRIGVETTEIAATETQPAMPRVRRRARAPADAVWFTSAGWQGVADGASDFGMHGLAVRIGRKSGSLHSALVLAASLPSTMEDDLTSVELARHVAAVAVGYELLSRERALVTAELGLGVVGFFRSTVALEPGAVPTPNRVTPALLVSPGARLLARPIAASESLWLEVSVGVDAVVGRPELGYESGEAFVRRDRLWPVQPRLGLGIGVYAF